MRKSIFKKIVASSVLSSVFACYMFPSMVFVNEETIYSNLNTNGEAYKIIAGTLEEDKSGNNAKKNEIQKDLPIECKVTYKLDGIDKEDIIQREIGTYKYIEDNYSKYVIFLYELDYSRNYIIHLNLLELLLNDNI